MPDIETVIKGLEICTSKPPTCGGCPYYNECKNEAQRLKEDALVLLKEQEPVEPIKPIDVDDSFTYLCSNCKGELFCGDRIRDKYCPTCGRVVKWDAEET